MQVRQLQDCVFEKIGSTGRQNMIAQNNLVDVYQLPFTFDVAESIFSFTSDLIWESYEISKSRKKYTMQKGKEDAEFLPMPKSIAEFISDNDRFWKLPLYWDENLVKRLFEYNA